MKPQPRYHRGDRIANRYRVHQALLGGMGEVYLCLDLEENYPYALKTFQQRYLTDVQRLRRAFEQEVATWVALEKHPNIVRCFYMTTLDNQPFMVLEWVAGQEGRGTDLRGWLRRGPLDLKLTLEIAIDICNGLLHAQSKRPGLVHRDLKPENILIAQGGLAKITDFGLAQVAQTAGLVLDDASVTSDRTAQEHRQSLLGGQGITGTPAYMAPEQWRGEPLDARTDIYALGCILYELLTGDSPFKAMVPAATPNREAVLLRTMQQAHEQAPIVPLPNELPTGLNDLVQHCLAKVPSARYPTVRALRAALLTLYQAHVAQIPLLRPPPNAFTAGDYNNRGLTYAALREDAAALADYARAIELDPTLAQAYYNRGNTYRALQEYARALADYTQAIKLNPTYAKAYCNRGVTYRALQEYAQALADYTQAIKLDPTLAQAYYSRGNTYDDLREYTLALADYTQAIKLDPTYVDAYFNLGVLLVNQGQLLEALLYMEKAAQLGDPQGAQIAGQLHKRLTLDPASPIDPAQAAFAAFQQANSLATMHQAVTRHPLLLQPAFIATIEQAIAQDAPPEHRPALTQRLTWLRQIANPQPRSTP